jgi:hypothetical protein
MEYTIILEKMIFAQLVKKCPLSSMEFYAATDLLASATSIHSTACIIFASQSRFCNWFNAFGLLGLKFCN